MKELCEPQRAYIGDSKRHAEIGVYPEGWVKVLIWRNGREEEDPEDQETFEGEHALHNALGYILKSIPQLTVQ